MEVTLQHYVHRHEAWRQFGVNKYFIGNFVVKMRVGRIPIQFFFFFLRVEERTWRDQCVG